MSRMSVATLIVCLSLQAGCGDDEPVVSDAVDASTADDTEAPPTDSSTADTDPSDTETSSDTDPGPVDTNLADAPDSESEPGSTNECAGLSVVERQIDVTDACADDASTGGVLPDLGEVTCRDLLAVDVEANGPVAFTTVDGEFANPTDGRDAVEWRAWVPERGPDEGVAPALVLMLHGFSANLSSLQFQSERLASHGFAVIAPTFPNAGFTDPPAHDLKVLEVQALMDLALDPAGPFAANINAAQIAIAGHSLGGKIGFYTAAGDARVDIVIGMDPNNGGGPPCFIGDGCNDYPVAPNCVSGELGVVGQIQAESLVFAAEDEALTPDAHLRAVHFYRGAPAPSHLVHFTDAGHADWISSNETRDFSLSVTTALLLRRFYGVSSVDNWLPGGAEVQAQLGGLLDRVESR